MAVKNEDKIKEIFAEVKKEIDKIMKNELIEPCEISSSVLNGETYVTFFIKPKGHPQHITLSAVLESPLLSKNL